MFSSTNPMVFSLLLFKVRAVKNQGKQMIKKKQANLLTLVSSPEVRMAAINALINSLDFIKANFEREVSDDNKNIFVGIC